MTNDPFSIVGQQAVPLIPSPRTLRDHVIICGLGNLGFRIYTQLDAIGIATVIVDRAPDDDFISRVHLGADYLIRDDARHSGVLEMAGIATARSLIATFDNDMTNLEIVLNATRLRPDLPIVMRFFNIDLAPSIRAALPNLTMLSLSRLASAAFVAAATNPHVRNAMLLNDEVFTVDEVLADQPGPVQELTRGRIVALTCRRGDEAPLVFPDGSQPIAPGDQVTLIGPERELHSLAALRARQKGTPYRRRKRSSVPIKGLATLLRRLDKALYVTLMLLALVLLASMLVFAAAKQMTPVDALVFFFTVVGATDAGAENVQQDPEWLKLYSILLAVIGAVALTTIYAFVTDYVVGVRLSRLLGQQPVTMEGHIVLCGMGTVGYRVLEGLVARGERVAVLESNPNNPFMPLIRAYRRQVRLVIGDARLRESLALVNVAEASCIVAATDNDMANIQTALHARQVNPNIRVVFRMFDESAAQGVADAFRFEVPLSASALVAPLFVSAAGVPSVIRSLDIAGSMMVVARLVAQPGCSAVGQPLSDVLSGMAARPLYHTPPGEKHHYLANGSTILQSGDTVVVVVPEESLRQVARCFSTTGKPAYQP